MEGSILDRFSCLLSFFVHWFVSSGSTWARTILISSEIFIRNSKFNALFFYWYNPGPMWVRFNDCVHVRKKANCHRDVTKWIEVEPEHCVPMTTFLFEQLATLTTTAGIEIATSNWKTNIELESLRSFQRSKKEFYHWVTKI